MPSAIEIDDNDVLLAIDLQADFMPGGALAVEDGRYDRAAGQRARPAFRPCRRHPGLASGGMPPSPRATTQNRSRRGASPTATRLCGPTIAFREPRARRSIRASRPTKPFSFCARACTRASIPIPPLSRRTARRQRGSPRSYTAQRQARLRLRPRDRLLRRLFRARRARRGVRDLRDRGRLPRDRRQRFPRGRLGQDERRRGLAHPVARNPGLSPPPLTLPPDAPRQFTVG